MSFSLSTAAVKSLRLQAGLLLVFMLSVGSCVQAQAKIAPQTPVIAGRENIIHDAQGDIFKSVEQSAEFPGGLNALYKYMGKNLRYPEAARKNDVQGKVFVTFVIEKNGLVSNVKIIRGIGHGCDEEAVRVIKASPKWKPGMQNKRPVRQQYTLPINFALADK